ncbi:MAG: T9SS type A sorting domain-containing protein, partial [Prolixibacteraceae bacterium]|nr:T9SS type A sorting domain-containing protein [Prolixibacteraceae bacterium]
QAAGEILYQSADSRGVYGVGKAYDTNVYDALVGAGYSVTYSQKGAINNADFDYSPYAAIVISAGESSGNVNTFAIAGYPIPCVTMQPDAPRSSKWGWTNSDKSGDASGQMMVTKIYDAETCKIKVTNNSHPITAGYAVDELITWSSGTAESEDFLGKEIKSYDLSANIPDAVALATIPADGTLLPTMWAVPAGASVNTKMPDGVVPVTLENSIVFMAVFNDGLLYMTDDFKPLLLSSLDWAITSSSACEFVPYYDNLTNLTPDPECSDLSLWGGWGLKSIVGPDSAYCGETAILLSDPTGAGCKWPDGSAALDVAPPNWLPNTTYHLRAMVKTVNGPIGFLASGSIDGSGPGGIDFGFPLDTHGEWVQLDTTFTTSDAPVQNFYSFNTCDYASTATETYIDNYELYALPAAASPKEIVFVKTENNNNDSIVVAAITNYADGTAYNVTVIEQGIITEDLLPQLNAADVVIMGRSIPSGDAATGKDVWDQITAPVLSMNMWAMRSSRALWTPSASCENMKQADDQFFQGVIVAPDDPVFKGITTEPFDWWWGNYSDFGVDAEGDDAGNGTLLAQTPDGKMLFARWEAGVEFYPGSGQIPQGERVYIGNGSDDGGVIAYFNWSETSELIFWRELARLSGYEMPATIADKVVIFVTDDNEDHEQIEWLESKGVNVTTYYPAGGLAAAPQEEIDMLNAADLIIVGRSPNSGDFDAPDKEAWNAITAPMIFNSQWVARNSRLNMFNSGNAIHENIGPDIAYGAVLDPNDVAFSFVEPTDGLLDWCTPPHDFIADVMETNGTILATWDQNPNAPLFARFEAGVEYYPGSVDMPAGPRTYFGFGNDNLGVVFFFPLTDNAKKVYWAEILNMLNLPVEEEIVSPDPYAILDPAYLDPASLGEGMSIVEMDGKAYVQVILNGWNSTITVPTFTLGEGWTAVADFKYSVADGAAFTLNQINAVVQIMDNVNKIPNPWGGTDPVPSSTGLVQSPATGDWKYVTAGVSADMKIVDMVQFFGQETVGWGPTVGDTMWIGKVRAMPVDPNVIVDPETFDPAKLNAGWEVVEISGKKYFKISLDGWSSWQGIPEYKFPEGTTGFKCMAKYEEGTSGFTVDQVNTFLKLSDPNWTEISAAGQASSATFIEYNVDIANTSMNAGVFQVAGQETTGWSAVAGDILYVGKLEVVLPIQKAPITFVIDDTKHKKYDGFSIRGSWVTATGEYDASWSGGVNHAQFTDDNGDNVWELTIELVPDGGANTWKWGFLDLNDTWLVTGADPTFTVVDATPQTITYIVGGTDVDFFSKNLSIYPNPVDNVLNISGVEIQSVKVLNLNGMVVLSEENTSGRIDLSSLKRGAYIVQVNGMNNEVAIRKLMKN